MNQKPSIKLILDSRASEEPKFLKIRILADRDKRTYSTSSNIKLTPEEFNNPRLKKTKEALEEAKRSVDIATEIIDELAGDFSFSVFGKLYKQRLKGKSGDKSLFSSLADEYLDTADIALKTKSCYKTALNQLYSFRSDLKLSDMNVDFVKEFMAHLKANGCGENTVRIYLRGLKAIYNDGIRRGLAKEPNPFVVKGQSLASIGREHFALREDEWSKFLKYVPESESEIFAKDFFLLSVMMCGANIGDILSLKNENIVDKEILFRRRKTKKTGLQISISLTSQLSALFNKYGKINRRKPKDYILPYLSSCADEKAILNKIHDIIKSVNRGLESICEAISIRKITTYVARHTYSVYFVDNGGSVVQLQKLLGHTSSRTTEGYLKSITQATKEKSVEVLDKILNM